MKNLIIRTGKNFKNLGPVNCKADCFAKMSNWTKRPEVGRYINECFPNEWSESLEASQMMPGNSGNPHVFVVEENITDFQAELDRRYALRKAFEANKQVEANAAYARFRDEKIAEYSELARGWYAVELPLFVQDYKRGGHKEKYTNWKVLANSAIEAYDLAVALSIEKLQAFWHSPVEKCQIDFYGVWTDVGQLISTHAKDDIK